MTFVIDMRHDSGAESRYKVADSWEGALAAAGEFWEQYDQDYKPELDQPFVVKEGYSTDLEVIMEKGESLTLTHAGGDGPFIRIAQAEQ